MDKPRDRPPPVPVAPTADGDEVEPDIRSRDAIRLCEHLDHLTEHLGDLVLPAAHMAQIRRRPWWR